MIAALVLAVMLTSAGPSGDSVVASNGCIRWTSTVTPPRRIRVLIDRSVVRVPFALYVSRVVSAEWNTVPTQLRLAGAQAVKQYGWWKAIRPRHSPAGCFDVHDDTRDQLYKVKSPPDYIWDAVRATWSWRVLRDGRLVHTGYRTGRRVGCARDVDGYHLFARSAARCARLGWSARRILATYYDARVKQ